jgi:hypothetical protein
MANESPLSATTPHDESYNPDPGSAIERSDAPQNPGLPEEAHRMTDKDPKEAKKAERRIALFFGLSILGSIFSTVAYVYFPIIPGDMTSVRVNNGLSGIGITLGLLGIGFGAVYWAKTLMSQTEMVEERHPTRGDEETREAATEIFTHANEESGFTSRSLAPHHAHSKQVLLCLSSAWCCSAIWRPAATPLYIYNHVGPGRATHP